MTRRDAGFTLIELMVATALMVVVVVYLTQTFTVQHRTYQVVDHTTESQQNLRAIAGLMEREVRHAGFMVPDNAALCGVDVTNGPDVLYVSDSDPLDPAGQTEPAMGAVVTGGYTTGTGSKALTVDNSVLDGAPFYDNDNDGVDDHDFQLNGGAILIDLENAARGRACGVVTAVTGTQVTVNFANSLGAAGALEDLRLVPAHVYRVGGASGLDLLRDGQVLATDVEDLQIAFFFDLDEDGAPEGDGSEYPGSDLGATFSPGAATWLGEFLREVRINVVARTRAEDPNAVYDEGAFETTENRAAVAGSDGFRRRVYTATVRLRNVGGRELEI